MPSDPYQWYLGRANFFDAWEITTGSSAVTVAVLDSGIAQDVPDLTNKIVAPADVSSSTLNTLWPAWKDDMGHGTEVASVLAAQTDNGVGIAGAGWNVMVMPVRLSKSGESTFQIDAEIRGIVYAVDHGADVINISAGSLYPNDAEAEAVQYALQHDVVVVAAAGNGGRDGTPADQVQYPAAYPGVIAVGATAGPPQGHDLIAEWSSRGTALTVVAPGHQHHRVHGPTRSAWSLSLGSAGHVVRRTAGGRVGRSDEVGRPRPDTGRGRQALISTAVDLGAPGFDETFGWGMIDAARALQAVGGQVTTTTLAPTTTTTDLGHPSRPRPRPPVGPTTTTSSTTTTIGTRPRPRPRSRPPRGSPTCPPARSTRRPSSNWRRRVSSRAISDGLFHPDDPATRQQFAKMVLLALGRTPDARP